MIFVNEPLTQNHLIVFFTIVAAVFHFLSFFPPPLGSANTKTNKKLPNVKMKMKIEWEFS